MLRSANRLITILVIVLISSFTVLSYSHAQVDSTYIGKFGQRYSVQVYSGNNFTGLYHIRGNDTETVYMPNTPVAIGLGLSWGKSSIGFGYGFPFMRDKKKGDTKSNMFSFQYHYYGNKFIADLFFQDYKGLYTEDEKNDEVYYFYPDIRVTHYGALWQYVFNSKKMSFRAAFNQAELQLKSAGSFLLGGEAFYNILRAQTTFNLNEKNRINNVQVGVSGGYAYTWVINRRLYLSGVLSVGVNVGTEYMDKFNLRSLSIYPSVSPRVAFGYNHDSWSLRLSTIYNTSYISYSEKDKMTFITGNLELTFIKRFGDIPILSKVPLLSKFM